MANQIVSLDEVKKALNIDSWRELSANKVTEFISLIPNMDREVAMKAIEQFPAYANLASNMISQLSSLCNKALETNENSNNQAIKAYEKILDDLSILIKKEDITLDEKKYITEQMIMVADKISNKDTENKIFIERISKYGGSIFTVALFIGVSLLGVKTGDIKLPQIKG